MLAASVALDFILSLQPSDFLFVTQPSVWLKLFTKQWSNNIFCSAANFAQICYKTDLSVTEGNLSVRQKVKTK